MLDILRKCGLNINKKCHLGFQPLLSINIVWIKKKKSKETDIKHA